jgi:hypothetical protein
MRRSPGWHERGLRSECMNVRRECVPCGL